MAPPRRKDVINWQVKAVKECAINLQCFQHWCVFNPVVMRSQARMISRLIAYEGAAAVEGLSSLIVAQFLFCFLIERVEG